MYTNGGSCTPDMHICLIKTQCNSSDSKNFGQFVNKNTAENCDLKSKLSYLLWLSVSGLYGIKWQNDWWIGENVEVATVWHLPGKTTENFEKSQSG